MTSTEAALTGFQMVVAAAPTKKRRAGTAADGPGAAKKAAGAATTVTYVCTAETLPTMTDSLATCAAALKRNTAQMKPLRLDQKALKTAINDFINTRTADGAYAVPNALCEYCYDRKDPSGQPCPMDVVFRDQPLRPKRSELVLPAVRLFHQRFGYVPKDSSDDAEELEEIITELRKANEKRMRVVIIRKPKKDALSNDTAAMTTLAAQGEPHPMPPQQQQQALGEQPHRPSVCVPMPVTF
jgi:hypothetical protein